MRQGKLEGVEGFQQFLLLRKHEYKHKKHEWGSTAPRPQPERYVEYVGQSFWAHEQDFYSYIQFVDGQRLPPGLSSFLAVKQPKDPTGYVTVLSEPILPEEIGGNVIVLLSSCFGSVYSIF